MVLEPRSPDFNNQILGRRIPHPKSTNYGLDNEISPERPSKRLKRSDTDDALEAKSTLSSFQSLTKEIADSEAESDDEDETYAEFARRTDLESALPPVNTDKEAIEEYEARKAAEQTQSQVTDGKLNDKVRVGGRSSIYVDAFNLALNTVLDYESHLFDEAELSVFRHWKDLNYEAQYL